MVGTGLLGGVAGGASVYVIIRAIDQYTAGFKTAETKIAGLKSAALGAAGGIAVGTAVVAGASAKMAADVETGYARVNTLLDEGQSSQAEFGDFVADTNVKLGAQGNQLDVLDGLYQTISAGVTDTSDAMLVMDAAATSSVGGMADQESIINLLTKTMASYGLDAKDASRLTDIFAGTVKAGQTTMEELATAMPDVVSLSGQLGISIEEASGTFAGLTKILGSTDEASTALSQVFVSFLKPTTAMKDAVQELGYDSAASMLEQEGLNESIKMLTDSVGGDSQAVTELFQNKRALKAVLPLVGKAAEDVATSIDTVTNSEGLAAKQAKDVGETTKQQWGEVLSMFQNLMIELGGELLPAIKGLAKLVIITMPIWKGFFKLLGAGFEGLGAAFVGLRDLGLTVWIAILKGAKWLADGVAKIVNGIVSAINVIISGINKVKSLTGGKQISEIGKVSFGTGLGDKIGNLEKLRKEKFESGINTVMGDNININVENLNARDPDDVAEGLNDTLRKKVNI